MRPIGFVGPAEFDALDAFISTNAFEIQSEEARRLAESTKISEIDLAYLFSALTFLYNQLRSVAGFSKTPDDAVGELLSELNLDDLTEDQQQITKTRLSKILRFNPNVEKISKIKRLQFGFLSNAIGFASFVDLRPNFVGEGVKEFLPIVQFRITTDSSLGSEKYVVFQIDEEGLDGFAKEIDHAKNKLRKLREDPAIRDRILSNRDD